jgi:RNA polymerase sigma factor FliA
MSAGVFNYFMNFKKNNPEEVEALWAEYFKTRSPKVVALLSSAYEPLIRKIVSVYLKKKPANLEYDDLFQAGRMGLLDAISRFDPKNGASFKTYASIRIRGSIIDEINSMDWTPRSVRKNIKTVIRSIEKYYEHEHSEAELKTLISQDTEFNEEAITTVMSQINKTYMVNMEPEIFEQHAPDISNEDQEFMIWLTMSIDEYFIEEEKVFINLKYFQELDNKTISSTMGLPQKDITNIRRKVLYKFSVLLNKPEAFKHETPTDIVWPAEQKKNEEEKELTIDSDVLKKLPHLGLNVENDAVTE